MSYISDHMGPQI
jgi:hypothetical protein